MIEWVLQNREIVKLIYSLIIILICIVIVIKTNRLFKLSEHTGIRYFRNAFFFFGIAFFIRYWLGSGFVTDRLITNPIVTRILFGFFLIMAGFFLLYSLLWKKIEAPDTHHPSSLFNAKISIFYLMTIIIVLIDYLWTSFYLLFLSQIIIFIFAAAISFSNYISKGKNRGFLMFYFVAMALSLVAWILNGLAALTLSWHPLVLTSIYLINIIIFLIFLFGIINFTR